MITYHLNIDCQAPKTLVSDLELVSGDVGACCLHIKFRDNGMWMELDDKLLTVKGKRADGKVISDCGTTEGTTAKITLKNSFFAVPGELILEIALTDAAKNYVTTKIVTANVLEGLGEPSETAEDSVSVFVHLLSRMKEQLDAADVLLKESKFNYEKELNQIQEVVIENMHFKGEAESVEALPETAENGDIYRINQTCTYTYAEHVSPLLTLPFSSVFYDVGMVEFEGLYELDSHIHINYPSFVDTERQYAYIYNKDGSYVGMFLYEVASLNPVDNLLGWDGTEQGEISVFVSKEPVEKFYTVAGGGCVYYENGKWYPFTDCGEEVHFKSEMSEALSAIIKIQEQILGGGTYEA